MEKAKPRRRHMDSCSARDDFLPARGSSRGGMAISTILAPGQQRRETLLAVSTRALPGANQIVIETMPAFIPLQSPCALLRKAFPW